MDKYIKDTVDMLDDILDAERAALLEGDVDKIGRLLERKETLIETLNGYEADDRAELEALNAKVARNQDLLNSALDGIRTVARRLATMRRIRNSLDTYDSKGRKTTIMTTSENSIEKRA